jgi:2-amino-4-hydroxy-6-hydroxymethyldihydropteridine diphosphokinase
MELVPKIVYLLLGGNLGDKKKLLISAIGRIQDEIGELTAKSSWYETAAWGNEDQPTFLNIALAVRTVLAPLAVLEKALQIEEELGRVRMERWGARLIDIDILLYGNHVIADGDRLQVPHPRMQERRFVLAPLAEIAGSQVHPVSKITIAEMLAELHDNLTVLKIG